MIDTLALLSIKFLPMYFFSTHAILFWTKIFGVFFQNLDFKNYSINHLYNFFSFFLSYNFCWDSLSNQNVKIHSYMDSSNVINVSDCFFNIFYYV